MPDGPGVYRFLDKNGVVIYVGKAKNLKRRVSQYFQSSKNHNVKTRVMVSHIADMEHTVVGSESDAFILENNLIKEYQPKYNILLKDGKTYPWICVRNEPFPRVFMTRRFLKDGSRYFGPYSSVMHVHQLLDLINGMYMLRTCNLKLDDESIAAGKYKVCLDYHIKKCPGPCAGHISPEKYKEQTDAIVQILKGNTYQLIREYERRMKEAAAELRFEEAQAYKENVEMLRRHYSKSLVSNPDSAPDLDVFYIVFDGADAFGSFVRVRSGAVTRSMNLLMKAGIEESRESFLSFFMTEIYDRIASFQNDDIVSKEILVPFMPDRSFEGAKMHVPEKGDKLSLLELAHKNAMALKLEKLKQEEFTSPQEHTNRILENLKRDLMMDRLPVHIECIDNSNIQGTNPVSACVVFKNAVPSKKDYRHFLIKTVVGPDDYASMKEVVNRRYSRMLEEGTPLPQLLIVDGGRGQVRMAYEALSELGLLSEIKLVGLAERMEEIIIPGDPYPLFLDKNSTSLKLMMQLRDEAHRFGITHHRNRRSKNSLVSELDSIKGIGPKTQDKLYARFKTLSRMKKATRDELTETVGLKTANILLEAFGRSSEGGSGG